MHSTHTYQRRREQELVYKLYNINFIVLQLNIERIRNELCHYGGPVALGTVTGLLVASSGRLFGPTLIGIVWSVLRSLCPF